MYILVGGHASLVNKIGWRAPATLDRGCTHDSLKHFKPNIKFVGSKPQLFGNVKVKEL